MSGKKWATFSILRKPNTKVIMELITKGGFSSKLRTECLVELGHEARTHCPSPSSNKNDALKSIHIYQLYERRQVITRQAYWKVCLDKSRYSLSKAPTLHLKDFTHYEYLELNLVQNFISN